MFYITICGLPLKNIPYISKTLLPVLCWVAFVGHTKQGYINEHNCENLILMFHFFLFCSILGTHTAPGFILNHLPFPPRSFPLALLKQYAYIYHVRDLMYMLVCMYVYNMCLYSQSLIHIL